MNCRFFLMLLSTMASMIAVGADSAEKSGVIHIDHEKVAAQFAHGGVILATNDFKVQAGYRTGPGEVEIHEHDLDIFYILEGSATFVTGGKAVDPKTTSPGEIRAKEIIGGEDRHLTKGD